MTWLEAFVWTCALETPVYVLLLRRSFAAWWAPVALSVTLQLATHPLLWRLYPKEAGLPAFLAAEAAVALAEAVAVSLLLRRKGRPRAFATGLTAGVLANALSAAVGRLL